VDDLQSEKEQIEEMRQWWSENGRYVIGGIVIGASLLFGWNRYESNKLDGQIEASGLFEALAKDVADGDLDNAERVADRLAQEFGNTSYTAQSKLAMARLYMDKNRDQDAADVLNQLLGISGNEELKNVGRLRLAKIMLYQDKAQEVIDLLDGQDTAAFAALYADALGDAHAALGNFSAAEEAYRTALADSAQGSIDRSLVQMKLIDLPEASAAPAEVVPAEVDIDDATDSAAEGPGSENNAENGPAAEDQDAE